MAGYSAIAIPFGASGGNWLVLAVSKTSFPLSPERPEFSQFPAKGMKAVPEEREEGEPFSIEIREDGSIQLLETVSYDWKVISEEPPRIESQLKSAGGVSTWSHREAAYEGSFRVINYLGLADFKVEAGGARIALDFEIISKKLDYFSEFRRMTEDIAKFCQQLLMSWDAPTSLTFETDGEKESRLILEQFLFLRGYLTEDRLQATLESISQRPHNHLEREEHWTPAVSGAANDWLRSPVTMGRDWVKQGGGIRPAQVRDVRKYDSHDTPPNRFVKFALTRFHELCCLVVEMHPEAKTLAAEAVEMANHLEAILARPFFREVGRMSRLPLENQTLQKRHGYRDILQSWLLSQAAASLQWKGHEETYQGPSRNVADLYEYWIFLKIHQILDDLPGITRDAKIPTPQENPDAFIQANKGELIINLKRSSRSQAGFIFSRSGNEGDDLKINLYYEKIFQMNDGATSAGSYSRQFKPDYTLSIFPASFRDEAEAVDAGKIAFLHFDAKYRAQSIKKLFGEIHESESDLDEEKEMTKAASIYKRGDLLKMHTYNDAIRQTIGSYVLYPGGSEQKGHQLNKFHELVPGVGAFTMKPGNDSCLETLSNFLQDVFRHQSDRFTQHRYMADAIYETVKEEPDVVEEEGTRYTVTRKTAPCVVHWMRKEDAGFFKENGFAYCHAVYRNDSENKTQLQLDLSTEIGSEFIPCSGGQGSSLITLGWRGKITGVQFLTTERLRELLVGKGITSRPSSDKATHYLFFEFDEVSDFPKRDITEVAKTRQSGSRYMAFSCRWEDLIS